MENFLGIDIPEGKAREEFLEANCDAVEPMEYSRRFSGEEMAGMKDTLSDLCIQINRIENEKKDVMDSFKEKLKPLNDEKKQLLEDIERQTTLVTGNCYKFIDHEEKMVGYYNKQGELVYSRPIQKQEMQKTIMSVSRTA